MPPRSDNVNKNLVVSQGLGNFDPANQQLVFKLREEQNALVVSASVRKNNNTSNHQRDCSTKLWCWFQWLTFHVPVEIIAMSRAALVLGQVVDSANDLRSNSESPAHMALNQLFHFSLKEAEPNGFVWMMALNRALMMYITRKEAVEEYVRQMKGLPSKRAFSAETCRVTEGMRASHPYKMKFMVFCSVDSVFANTFGTLRGAFFVLKNCNKVSRAVLSLVLAMINFMVSWTFRRQQAIEIYARSLAGQLESLTRWQGFIIGFGGFANAGKVLYDILRTMQLIEEEFFPELKYLRKYSLVPALVVAGFASWSDMHSMGSSVRQQNKRLNGEEISHEGARQAMRYVLSRLMSLGLVRFEIYFWGGINLCIQLPVNAIEFFANVQDNLIGGMNLLHELMGLLLRPCSGAVAVSVNASPYTHASMLLLTGVLIGVAFVINWFFNLIKLNQIARGWYFQSIEHAIDKHLLAESKGASPEVEGGASMPISWRDNLISFFRPSRGEGSVQQRAAKENLDNEELADSAGEREGLLHQSPDVKLSWLQSGVACCMSRW